MITYFLILVSGIVLCNLLGILVLAIGTLVLAPWTILFRNRPAISGMSAGFLDFIMIFLVLAVVRKTLEYFGHSDFAWVEATIAVVPYILFLVYRALEGLRTLPYPYEVAFYMRVWALVGAILGLIVAVETPI